MNSLVDFFNSFTNSGRFSILFFPFILIGVLLSSLKLVKFSEVIMSKTNLKAGFIGGFLIALITSMPELITEITQANAGYPENGLADDIGSNAFSIFLIGFSALLTFRKKFLNKLQSWTKISLLISFLTMTLLSIFLMINKDVDVGFIGLIPLFFFIVYVSTVVLAYKYGDDDISQDKYYGFSKKEGIVKFILAGLFVIVFSVLVNANAISFQNALDIPSESVGGIFLAITTSLPELVAFLAFLKKGHVAVAISSLVGSHFFNIGILFFGDLTYHNQATFNKIEMHAQYPIALMTSLMLLMLVLSSFLSQKLKYKFSTKKFYLIAPIVVTLGYIIGWILILSLN